MHRALRRVGIAAAHTVSRRCMTPAAISLLLVHLARQRRERVA